MSDIGCSGHVDQSVGPAIERDVFALERELREASGPITTSRSQSGRLAGDSGEVRLGFELAIDLAGAVDSAVRWPRHQGVGAIEPDDVPSIQSC